MAETRSPEINKEKIKRAFTIHHFDLNAIFRGAQLTLVGAQRALSNPAIFTSEHYRQAAIAVASGILIRILIAVPIYGVKVSIWFLSFLFNLDAVSWDDKIVDSLGFIEEHVLQVPLFLMTLMRYLTPSLDNLFMDSLRWVDITYTQKHKNENPEQLRGMYYPNLQQYRLKDGSTHSGSAAEAISMFLIRFAKKGLISLAVFALSYIPYLGPLVLPAASFYTFNKAAGLGPAAIIFGTGIFLPRRYLVIFLQSYFASRSLMRELLEPYFARIHFSKDQKRKWFHSREGVLFGFALGFYTMLRVPIVGVLIYGIAEASTAYLVSKITDPPPPPSQSTEFAASQQQWRNKHEFLSLSLANLDAIHGNPRDEPPSYDEAVASRTSTETSR